jgi:hypothetical protein
METRCPDCGEVVPHFFDHVDGCPSEKRSTEELRNEADYHQKLDDEMLQKAHEKSFDEDYYKDQPEYFGAGYDPSEYISDDGDDPLLELYY